MDTKIEEAHQEFNAILHYILVMAMGRQIHEVEAGIYLRLLRLGRILLELFVLATGTRRTGEPLMRQDGAVFRYLQDSGCKYLSIFGDHDSAGSLCEGGDRGLFPLDATLNLPERKYFLCKRT